MLWFPPTPPPSTLHPIEVRLFCPDSVRLSTWCVVVSSWSYSSQLLEIAWVKKIKVPPPPPPLCFISLHHRPRPICFISLQSSLWRFILILMYLFCKAIWMLFFINSLGNSRNFLHYQWPEEFTKKQKKPASKWHQIALYERLMSFFCSNYRIILKSIVLLLRHCKRKWSQSYLNAKKRYLGMTWVTKKLHESIAKLNYEFNNSKKRFEG